MIAFTTIRMPSAAFFRALYRSLLFVAIALSLAMAVLTTTAKQVHHDEYDHVTAARFYVRHWLPPAAEDPRILDTYSLFGYSYLNEWDVVYLAAGKFAALVDPLVGDFMLTLRLFNVGLFLLLGCLALLSRSAVLGIAFVLTSPQLWYTFGYFNADSFPLFVSFVMVAILALPGDAPTHGSRAAIWRYLALGLCIGLLILSKKTFWAFGLFAGGVIFWLEFWRCRRDGDWGGFLRRMGLVAAVVLATAGPRIAWDVHVNGGPAQKQAKLTAIAERLSASPFKTTTGTRWNLDLRRKGISLVEMMFPPYDWPKASLYTMFGAYNYAAEVSYPHFYHVFLSIYGLFLFYMAAVVFSYANLGDRVITWGAVASIALVIGLSVYHSWTSDFQAQGRYLFAIFAIVAVVLVRNWKVLNPAIVHLFLIAAFLLSMHSFVKVGLKNVPHYRDVTEFNPDFVPPVGRTPFKNER